MQKWNVVLSKSDCKKAKMSLRSKNVSMEAKKRAQVLLDSDEANGRNPDSISMIMKKRGIGETAIIRTKRKYVEGGIDLAIFRKKRALPPTPAKVTGDVEAHIIACACSAPPEGFSRWSMKMIANKVVLDGIIDTISDEAVRLVLKKHGLNRI